jgi:hypothetical protein
VLHALVLAAQALPVGDRAKDAGAEQTIALGLEGTVIDRLRLGNFTMRPGADFFGRRKLDADGVEVGDGTGQFKWAGTVQGVPPEGAVAL